MLCCEFKRGGNEGFGKTCFRDLLHFKCNPTGEQVNVGNPGVEKREKSVRKSPNETI